MAAAPRSLEWSPLKLVQPGSACSEVVSPELDVLTTTAEAKTPWVGAGDAARKESSPTGTLGLKPA